jgi:DNA-binding response OmpR family regulator
MQDILVIEDGVQERERLVSLFSQAGYQVSSAESAEEAEKLLKSNRFRLSFLDIGLGDKSGTHLFQQMKKTGSVNYIVIFTGNPSVHLKQRFLDEGAANYIIKASPGAKNESLLELVTALLGAPIDIKAEGLPLIDFLASCLNEESRELFLDENNNVSPCAECGGREFVVSFNHKTQLPPTVEGKVVCIGCGKELDPEIG